jgi:hypothetical protein
MKALIQCLVRFLVQLFGSKAKKKKDVTIYPMF